MLPEHRQFYVPRMPDSSLPVEATQDASTAGTQTPVLVTEQLVMFSTTAMRPRLTQITYRVIGTIGILAAASRPPLYCAHRTW